ncbi:DUF1345 domain-containing protein [Naumannella sp. ID2617S]|nr:DUF1345 domain-containing protein [Naumannella sp. ID2617S]
MTRYLWPIFVVAELLLVAVGVLFVMNMLPMADYLQLAFWDLIAVVYLIFGAVIVWSSAQRADRGEDDPWKANPRMEGLSWLLPYITSVVGIVAALLSTLAKANEETSPELKVAYNVLAAAAMILSWGVLQFGLARQYERTWRLEQGGFRFPDNDRPRLADFAYFSFTLGASFATSDVEVPSSRMRARVIMHAIWCFLYDAAIVALAISLITGR